MRIKKVLLFIAGAVSCLMVAFITSAPAAAHCDTLDGPVVALATKALEAGNVNLVLPWVGKSDEAEIRRTFAQTLSVRKLGPEARQLADSFFFETLVRLHRASEGAPYTGLKPAGLDLGPAIPEADKALQTGSTAELENLLIGEIRKELKTHFHAARARMDFNANDVAAGREYVKAYVSYVHYVEGLWESATSPAHGHYPELAAHPDPHQSAAVMPLATQCATGGHCREVPPRTPQDRGR
jgi:uncharacterized protein DUF6448